jgi:hypothetical protein
MHEGEADQHFPFSADEFASCGLFLDIDFWREKGLSAKEIPGLLKGAQGEVWKQVERIAHLVGV